MLNVSNNFKESKKSNFVDNSINFILIRSPILSDPLHPPYIARRRGAQAEYLGIIKMALRNCRKDINFSDPVQMSKVHGDLMKKINS